jgi:hypothetical protein
MAFGLVGTSFHLESANAYWRRRMPIERIGSHKMLRYSRAHLIGGHGDHVWETGKFFQSSQDWPRGAGIARPPPATTLSVTAVAPPIPISFEGPLRVDRSNHTLVPLT